LRNEKKAVESLQEFVKALVKARVKDKAGWRRWKKRHEAEMEKFFWHKKTGAKMPSITALVGVFFHPTEPFIGLNYTPVAHNTLHAFPDGWTLPLRLCRGIIFSRRGKLLAKPFTKFFNYGEHEETKNLPVGPFEATVKHDGHLGIIFEYENKFWLTTRGDFQSRTSKIGSEMLAAYAKKGWQENLPKDLTVLVEIIHPSTKVHLDYAGEKKFILIGACDRKTLEDLTHVELYNLGALLGLPVAERWNVESVTDMKKLMEDLTVQNREGFVARFQNSLRVKFKFSTYINKMVGAKLSYRYIMKRIMAGNLEKMIKFLPEEIYGEAQKMVENLRKVKDLNVPEKEKREYLYNLVPEKESNSGYRSVCREFLKFLEKN
jgi:RNA ligase